MEAIYLRITLTVTLAAASPRKTAPPKAATALTCSVWPVTISRMMPIAASRAMTPGSNWKIGFAVRCPVGCRVGRKGDE